MDISDVFLAVSILSRPTQTLTIALVVEMRKLRQRNSICSGLRFLRRRLDVSLLMKERF